jgi:hypothetical protein
MWSNVHKVGSTPRRKVTLTLKLQRQVCHLNGTVANLIAAKFKSSIFSIYGFAMFCAANMLILMILYDLSFFLLGFC